MEVWSPSLLHYNSYAYRTTKNKVKHALNPKSDSEYGVND